MEALQIEDITSKEYLDNALKNAVSWCSDNLSRYLKGFQDDFDYSIFHYVVDESILGADMCLDDKKKGLVRVSTKKLKKYLEIENIHKTEIWPRYAQKGNESRLIEGAVEIDPESMFVHEMAEHIIYNVPEVLINYFLKKDPHLVAYEIENINRAERGLELWPIA